MKVERRTIATKDIWQKGLDTLRATWRQTLIIAAAGLVLPQLLLGLGFDAASAGVVSAMRESVSTAAGRVTGYETLVAPAMSFIPTFAFMMVTLAVLAISAYFALVHVVVQHHRGETPPTSGAALIFGLKTALARGIWLVAALAILIFLGQFLIAPALLVAILSLNLPVILVAERKGGWRALGSALGLRYVRGTPYSPWNVMFTLLTLAAFLYMAVALTAMLVETMMNADVLLGIGRGLWSTTLGGLPFGPVYLVSTLVETTLLALAIAIMPALTTALYFLVVGKRELGEA